MVSLTEEDFGEKDGRLIRCLGKCEVGELEFVKNKSSWLIDVSFSLVEVI